MDGIDPGATVIFVLNHRSNMDYVLVTWLASRRTALSYAVGEWGMGWPLRPLIRAMGGYFVRRRDLNRLYRKVLARYVQIATAEGVTQAIFPEGRLSRDGTLSQPKLGLLSYLIEDFGQESRDIVFVPVALNYERVLEDRVLLEAAAQGASAFRLRWWQVARHLLNHLQLRLTRRFTRFGYAAVAFGRPMPLRRVLAGDPGDPVEAVARALMGRVARALPVLPIPLVCEALMEGRTELGDVAVHLNARSADLRARGFPVHHVSRDPYRTAMTALRMLEVRKIVRIADRRVTAEPGAQTLIGFYAATLPSDQERHKITRIAI
jgi:glycerol-3-phosphate O-acyltransferase